MKYFSIKKINKAILFILSSLIIKGALAFQHTSPDDYSTVQQWIKNTGFETHSVIDHGVSLTDLQSNILVTLHALHTSRTEHFYDYLAQLIIAETDQVIAETDQDEPLLSLLLKLELDLNKPQDRIFESLITEKNETELAHWLRDYIGLEKHLTRNKRFYSFFFLLLTKATTSKLQLCPEVSMIEHLKSAKEKRRTLLQCLAKITNTHIIDIDISKNRVVTSRILSPKKIETHSPTSAMMDNSESHIIELLHYYHTLDFTPIILLTSQKGNEFITPLKMEPDNPLKESQKKENKEQHPDNEAENGYKKDERLAFLKSDNIHWLVPWIKSPGYSIALWGGVGVAVTLFVIYAPYPGNLFL